jgi:proton-dependent oligopeptide transporter, POT family
MNDMSTISDKAFLGQPRGLSTLFFTEMWERFSYYGMRAILMLFMTTAVERGGLGFTAEKAGPIYAMYTSMVYLAAVPGGWLADNLLGQRRAVLYGGMIIMLGHVLLAMHGISFFYAGLCCVVLGTGLLKPNISVIVGSLYDKDDNRRDAGFSIFYMGINIGAFSAPLVCGWLAQSGRFREFLTGIGVDPLNSWHWGFGAAAVGMFFGLLQYLLTSKTLGDAGLLSERARDPKAQEQARQTLKIWGAACFLVVAAITTGLVMFPHLATSENIKGGFAIVLFTVVVTFFGKLLLDSSFTKPERARLLTILVLFCGASIFWGIFEQAGSTLTLFADRSTKNEVFGVVFPSAFWQSTNAALLVLFAPVFAWLWQTLGRRDPSVPLKFAFGILFAGLGFAVLVVGASQAMSGERVSPLWLFSVYLLHTIGELCLSPVGLSSMTKLAPVRVVSLMMGVWFLATAVGNFLGGSVSGYYEKFSLPTLFAIVATSGFIMSAFMFALVRPIKHMLARSDKPAADGPLA